MPFETYAQRKRRQERAGRPMQYTFDSAPPQLRYQIGVALKEGIGEYKIIDTYGLGNDGPDDQVAFEVWQEIDRACRKEVAVYREFMREEDNFTDRVVAAIERIADFDEFLGIVEISCKVMESLIDKEQRYVDRTQSDAAAGALEEINWRFEQHGVGYQFQSGWIICKDNQFIHAEAIEPALAVLAAPEFAKANREFITAHRLYRNREFKDAVTAANRAFETMLKLICDFENWAYDKRARASDIVTVVSNNGLFTHDFDKGLEAYIAMLKTGLPGVRNEAGGHGEGLAAKEVTAGIARYAINLTASNVVFLGDAYAGFKGSKGKKP